MRDENGKYLGTFACSSQGHRRGSLIEDKLGASGCLDALTGVLNLSMIQAHLTEHINLNALYPVPFSVMCYTGDDLDTLSERYGRAAKEAALRMTANAFESGLRPTDFLGRWLSKPAGSKDQAGAKPTPTETASVPQPGNRSEKKKPGV